MVVVFYILFLLVFGSLNTLTTKWQFSMTSVGEDGVAKHFQKPWWGNFAMFLAMTTVLGIYWVQKRSQRGQPDTQPLLGGQDPALQRGKACRDFFAVSVPAVLDLISSGLNFMGLIYISASVWQMLRGSMIVFSAVLSIIFLGRRMHGFHWVGIGICVVGITCVGAASILEDDPAQESKDENNMAAVGVLFVMIAQVVQAAQCVAEERLLKKINLAGTLIVGYEGVWGCLIMLAFVFPLMQVLPGSDVGGAQENTIDTLVMIDNSSTLQIMLGIYLISCCTYNIARMLVTSNLSAVHFTMIDASRTAIIWTLDLGVFYFGSNDLKDFGETWTAYSPLQAFGFCLLISGQCIYGGLLQLPFSRFYPSEAEMRCFIESQMISPASRHMATPLPPYSPPREVSFGGKQKSWDNLNAENPFDAVMSPERRG